MKKIKLILGIILCFSAFLWLGRLAWPYLLPVEKFSGSLVSVDSAEVESLQILSFIGNQKNEISVVKTNNIWIATKDNISINISDKIISNFLNNLSHTYADSIVKNMPLAPGSRKYHLAWCVKNNTRCTDLFVGLDYQNPTRMQIRASENGASYWAQNDLGALLARGFSLFRDTNFLEIDTASVKKFSISTQKCDTVYIFERQNKIWVALYSVNQISEGKLTYVVDNQKVKSYLTNISRLHFSEYADFFSPDQSSDEMPFSAITLEQTQPNQRIQIALYRNANKIYAGKNILYSSQNPNSYFLCSEEEVRAKIFVAPHYFFLKHR